jgi:protease-4
MKSIFNGIAIIFQTIWHVLNFIRQSILNVFLLLIIIILVIAFQQQVPEQIEAPKKAALVLNLNGELVEQEPLQSPMTELSQELTGEEMTSEIDIHELTYVIKHAKSDASVTGLVLDLSHLSPTSLTKLRIVGAALSDFQSSNKPIIAIGDNYSQSQYYLASFANEIILNTQGAVLLRGFAAQRLYYKDVLENLAINTHVFRVGSHKSFVEPYIRNSMSAEAKSDLSHWMNQLWQVYRDDVAQNRRIAPDALTPSAAELIQRLKAVDGNAAQYAQTNHLVDHLMTRSEARQYLSEKFGKDADERDFLQIDYAQYLAQLSPQYPSHPGSDDIAVIVAQGPIVSGQNNGQVIAAETLISQLDTVRTDDSIKGLVLRVDSPGGSAFASELIRVKLADIQATGKPVVVSMASTAASGGYWIAATADQIFVSKTTITGSIGIFGLFATFENSLNKLGIHSDGFATTEYASNSPLKSLPDDVATIIQMNVENGYKQFTTLVSAGRNIAPTDIDELAQGRIWTGQDAVNNGLADQIGGLDEAISYLAQKLNLQTYDVIQIKPKLSQREQLIASLLTSQASTWLNQHVPFWSELSTVLQQLPTPQLFNDPQGHYLYCEACAAL